MAKARSLEAVRVLSRMAAVEDLNSGIEKLQALLAQVEDMSREGFPYQEAVRARTELALRETIRQIFGEKSPEYQIQRPNKPRAGNRPQSLVGVIKQLLAQLEQKRSDLLDPPQEQPPSPEPPLQRLDKPPLTPVRPSHTARSASTHSFPPPKGKTPPAKGSPPEGNAPSVPSDPAPLPDHASSENSAPGHASAARNETQEVPRETGPVEPRPANETRQPPARPDPAADVSNGKDIDVRPAEAFSRPAAPAQSASQPADPDEALEALRSLCARFHAVARRLRIRHDGRATLEVEDEFDVQDLLCALLHVRFEEVDSEDSSAGDGATARHRSYHLHNQRVTVVAKKTRAGMTSRDLMEQVKREAAHHAARVDCRLFLCFIYDPEGRIGNPRAFESDLTTVSDSFTLEVIVAPK